MVKTFTPFYCLLFVLLLAQCKSKRDDPPVDPGSVVSETGFTVEDFRRTSGFDIKKNVQAKGPAIEMGYKGPGQEAEFGSNFNFDVKDGFETAFTFQGTQEGYLQIRLFTKDESLYNPYGISASMGFNLYNIGHASSRIISSRSLPTLFDGQRHTVRILMQNRPSLGLLTKVFVDDMNEPAYECEDGFPDENIEIYSQGSNATRRISLLFFNNYAGEGKVTLHNWSFRPL
ncbi:hypothetical protein [Larkinella soli]|uniref:hypothetical protein n=1 Tax=Larkinella soli TaxID=1770527 RepID=UPI000FFC3AF3|nr:hypothetical protein [Larkinella soli]